MTWRPHRNLHGCSCLRPLPPSWLPLGKQRTCCMRPYGRRANSSPKSLMCLSRCDHLTALPVAARAAFHRTIMLDECKAKISCFSVGYNKTRSMKSQAETAGRLARGTAAHPQKGTVLRDPELLLADGTRRLLSAVRERSNLVMIFTGGHDFRSEERRVGKECRSR